MRLKGDGLTEEDVKDYFEKKKLINPSECVPSYKKPLKPPIKKVIKVDNDKLFRVEREVVDVIDKLYKGEDKIKIELDGCKIVGYKIKAQGLVRVDIYNK